MDGSEYGWPISERLQHSLLGKEQKNMMCVMFLCSGDFDMDTRTFADFNIVWWGKVKNMMCLMFLCSDDISRPQHSLLGKGPKRI